MTEIGNAYGNALFLLAKEENKDTELLEQLEAVCGLLRENPDYVRLLSSPVVKKSQRLELLREGFEGKTDEYLMNFMCILAENNTFAELPSCLEAFQRLYNEHHGIIEVTAYTAVPMSKQQQKALSDKLGRESGKRIVLKNAVDPSLIGGVRLEMSGRRLDGSVQARLNAIRESLLTAKA